MLPASVALCALAILLLPAGAASHRAASPSALGELSVVSHRPAASTWRRTQCGSPSGDADIPTRWASEVSADTTPLPAYPRPQMVRGRGGDRDKGDPSLWSNLNGLWEWEPAADAAPPFGRPLNGSILVPFPVESCLSGVAPASSATLVAQMWYRLVFDAAVADGAKTLLHFGAVDWQATVYLNGLLLRHDGRLGNHTGGYDGFGFDVTDRLKHAGNELLVHVLDPSDAGAQPNGKQRVSAVDRPGGDTYTPSSGIWQTVWMEAVPPSYISTLKIDQASTTNVKVTAFVEGGGATTPVRFEVVDRDGTTVAEAAGAAGSEVSIFVARATAWSPSEPYLYDLKVSTPTDAVTSYFGLRTFALGDGPKGRRPLLNGNFTFLAGFLDQSWWPDGQYTAPTDEALAFDVEAVATFGLNMIRLHQKVNPERWYWHADRLGALPSRKVCRDGPEESPEAAGRDTRRGRLPRHGPEVRPREQGDRASLRERRRRDGPRAAQPPEHPSVDRLQRGRLLGGLRHPAARRGRGRRPLQAARPHAPGRHRLWRPRKRPPHRRRQRHPLLPLPSRRAAERHAAHRSGRSWRGVVGESAARRF